MEVIMLGTGNATVTQCYNTCFVLQENDRYFLVDGGGGNGLLHQLEAAHLNWQDMRTIFVTHKHGSSAWDPLDGKDDLSEYEQGEL